MTKFNLLLSVILIFLCTASCKKTIDDTDNTTTSIVGKKWKLTAYTSDGVDIYNETYEPCEQDNIQIFAAGGKYILDEGAMKCDENDPQIGETGVWKMSGNKLTFGEADSALQITATVTTLTNTTLKLSLINPLGTETLIYTFIAQ